ncbi:MAG: hypothetical protein IKY82_03375 [Alistipes sp.]|nr:hypothetical protein [Alistipes sp.]
MKKILLSFTLLAMAATMTGCSQKSKWDHKQKRAMREALREYRDMVYLADLTEPEFVIFTDDVANDIETVYPVYTTFMQMPGVNDTIDVFVVTTIVDELNADAHNMRHIYPYRYLVSEGILPNKLSFEQQHQFYKCFAQKVNQQFFSMEQFFNAVLSDTTQNSSIAQMQQQCANELFDWVVEVDEVDIIE